MAKSPRRRAAVVVDLLPRPRRARAADGRAVDRGRAGERRATSAAAGGIKRVGIGAARIDSMSVKWSDSLMMPEAKCREGVVRAVGSPAQFRNRSRSLSNVNRSGSQNASNNAAAAAEKTE